MNKLDLDSLVEDDKFYVKLDSNIWLMDNHRWAFYIWEQHRQNSHTEKFSLIHADYHWDSVNDLYDSPEQERALLNGSLESLFHMVNEGNFIRYDSFIAPAVKRGFLSEIHFYCKQDDDWDAGIDADLLSNMDVAEFKHDSVESLSNQIPTHPIIFDLCLDLFNRDDHYYKGDLWSDLEIMRFLNAVKDKIIAAELITVSLSFGYSGNEEDTRKLAKLVIPILEEWRK